MPTSKRPLTREEQAAARKAAELEAKREAEALRVAEHNRRVQASATAQKRPDRIISKPRPLPPIPLDLEASRNRRARPLSGKKEPYRGMPYDAASMFGSHMTCPHCGYPMLGYHGRGAYYCATQRVSQSKHQTTGCGRYSYGPCNPDETPYSAREREILEDPELLPL